MKWIQLLISYEFMMNIGNKSEFRNTIHLYETILIIILLMNKQFF